MLQLTKPARKVSQVPGITLSFIRQYSFPLSLEFSEDVSGGFQAAKPGVSTLDTLNNCKTQTEESMNMLKTYKDLGDVQDEALLKYHNPRTFEDLHKPVPNFRKQNLKPGQVARFFDSVLQKRAEDSIAKKTAWWNERRTVAQEAIKQREFSELPKLETPEWQIGKPVALDTFEKVTDKYFKSLEPKKKLRLPVMPAQVSDALSEFAKGIGQEGKVADAKSSLLRSFAEKAVVEEDGKTMHGYKYATATDLQSKLQARRSAVHNRWVKMWAKRLFSSPEQALVPLKERDHLLASRSENMSKKYDERIYNVALGPIPFGERLAETSEMNSFLLRRDKDKVREALPPSEQELEAAKLAKELEDKAFALEKLLGPSLLPEGSSERLASEEVTSLTDLQYTPDRYMYKEGMKLAAKYVQEEEKLAEELKAIYGDDIDVRKYQRVARSNVQKLLEFAKEVELRKPIYEKQLQEHTDDPYMCYVVSKRKQYYSDPSNLKIDEVLYPKISQETFEIEMKEIEEKEKLIDEAEEEEAWLLTLLKQARHFRQQAQFDLPQQAVTYMDPLLYKKIDWELTHGWDLMHMEVFATADCEQGQYLKDQWGIETLSHHFLPLIRYRRQKERALKGTYPPELANLPKDY